VKIHKVDLIPLKALILYIFIGVSLSFFGPVAYMNYDKLLVGTYMMAFIILFSMGYTLGLIEIDPPEKNLNIQYQNNNLRKILFWVKVSIIIIASVQFINLILSLSAGTLNLSVSNMGQAYIDTYENYERGTGNVSLTFLVQIFTYIPYLITLILGAFYFKQLPRFYQVMIIFSYLSIIIIETIGHGKQKQLGDIFIFLLLVFFLKSNLLNKYARKKIFRKVVFFGLIGVSALVSVLYFRYAALGVSVSNINERINPLMEFDLESIIFQIFGDEIGFPISVFSTYLSQGYYGLSLAMQQPFEWTYFVGNSYSLAVLMQRYFALPIDFHDTYAYRTALNTDWDESKWFSVFTWYAGDITFIGALILFSLVAILYAKVWKEAYMYQNPISVVLFAMLTIAMLYIPSNNQLLHTPGSIIAVFFFLILWIFKHKKFNFYRTTV